MKLEDFAYIATISVPFIALIAAAIAWIQIRATSRATRRSMAYQIYNQYLMMAYQNPTLAYPRSEKIIRDANQYDAYRWFLSAMLLAFEEILYVCPDEKDWKETISDHLNQHWWHLETSRSAARHWKPALSRLIAEVRKNQVGKRDGIQPPKMFQVPLTPTAISKLKRRR